MTFVYKLSAEQAANWAGTYNGQNFEAQEDASGNLICSLGCAECPDFPFVEELKACEKIVFNPRAVSVAELARENSSN